MSNLVYNNPLLTLIRAYNNFKNGSNEKTIAQAMLKNISAISNYTIEQTSESCNISISTCRRFIHNLGYSSYAESRMNLKQNIDNMSLFYPAEINRESPESTPFLEHYGQLLKDDLDILIKTVNRLEIIQASQMLHEHQRIFIHDLLDEGMRVFLLRNLALSGKLVTLSCDYNSQINDLNYISDDCLFLIVYDGQMHSRNILHTIKQAKESKASVIVISNQKKFTNSELCDIVIHTCPGQCVLSKLLGFDIIFQYLAEMYRSMYLP